MEKILKWLDNFWYHYKWHTIIGAVFAIFLAVCIGQMASKDKVDSYIMYAGPIALTAQEIEDIESAFETVVGDYNGDGKKTVQLIDITLLTDSQLEENRKKAEEENIKYNPDMEYIYNMRQKLNLQLASGDAYILLMDSELFEENYSVGVFEKLEKMGVSSEIKSYNDSALYFDDTFFGKTFSEEFKDLKEDLLLSFRKMNVTSKAKGKKEQQKYENQIEFFKELTAQ